LAIDNVDNGELREQLQRCLPRRLISISSNAPPFTGKWLVS